MPPSDAIEPPFVSAERYVCSVSRCTEWAEWVHLIHDGDDIYLCRTHHAEGVSDRDRSAAW